MSEVFCEYWKEWAYRAVKSFRYGLFCAARDKAFTHARLHFKQGLGIEEGKESWIDDESSRMPKSASAFEELQSCLKELALKMPPRRRPAFIDKPLEREIH